jgi:hypothetical protein
VETKTIDLPKASGNQFGRKRPPAMAKLRVFT